MPRTVSASDARADLATLINWVEENQDVVILEVDGIPQVAVVAYEQYEELIALREQRGQEESAIPP